MGRPFLIHNYPWVGEIIEGELWFRGENQRFGTISCAFTREIVGKRNTDKSVRNTEAEAVAIAVFPTCTVVLLASYTLSCVSLSQRTIKIQRIPSPPIFVGTILSGNSPIAR